MSGFAEGTPTVEIQLGGKSYTLGWTWGSKRRLQERLRSANADMADAISLSNHLPAAVWAALDRDARSELSVEDVEELINPRNEEEVVDKLNSLFKASEPDPEPEGKEDPVAVRAPTTGKSTSTNSVPLEFLTSA